jgi:hypothetical protein
MPAKMSAKSAKTTKPSLKKNKTDAGKKSSPKEPSEPIIPKEKPRITAGFIALVVFFGLTAVLTLISFFTSSAGAPGIFLGFEYNALTGFFLSIIGLLVAIVLIWGIFKRICWTRDVALVYHAILILNGIVSLILYFVDRQRLIDFALKNISPATMQQIQKQGITTAQLSTSLGINLLVVSIFVIVIGLAIFIFYFKKKDFFSE